MFYFKEKPATQMFYKISILKNFANFTLKLLCWNLFLISADGLQLYLKETPTQMFSCAKFLRTPFYRQDDKCLAEELQKYSCLYEKGNKGYKNRDWEEVAWRTVE